MDSSESNKTKTVPLHKSDVVFVYQDFELVEKIVDSFQDLHISYCTIPMDKKSAERIRFIEPKIVVVSTRHLITSVEFYLYLLKENNNDTLEHYSILVTNAKEAERAFITCENGLFDNYAIINPLNNPWRLKLIVIQALEILSDYHGKGIAQLLTDGYGNLADAIEQASELKTGLLDTTKEYHNLVLEQPAMQNLDEKAQLQVSQFIRTSMDNFETQLHAKIDTLVGKLQKAKDDTQTAYLQANKRRKTAQDRLDAHDFSDENNSIIDNLARLDKKQHRILISQHNLDYSQTIASYFKGEKFVVDIAKDGAETLQKLDTFEPDLLLIEYNLPDVSGMEITKAIRRSGSTLSIIVLSSCHDKKVIKKWVPLGIGAYLVKPSSEESIVNSVTNELLSPTHLLRLSANVDIDSVKWLPEYSVGIPNMDEHHIKLFDLTNEYLQIDDDKDALLQIFSNIERYMQMHFGAEEKLLENHNFPNLQEHKFQHRKMLNKMEILRRKQEIYGTDISYKVGMFLYRWLANHILKTDMEYKQFFLDIDSN